MLYSLDDEWLVLADHIAEAVAERVSKKQITVITPVWLDTGRAARAFGYSQASLDKFRLRGNGPPFCKTPSGKILYNRCEFDAWVRSGPGK